MKFEIEEHNRIDKRFRFGNGRISMLIDYDDVDHSEVDAMLRTIKSVLEDNWDQKLFLNNLSEELIKHYHENPDIAEEYGSLERYLERFVK